MSKQGGRIHPQGNPFLTAVAVKKADSKELVEFARNNRKFSYVEGYVEKLPAGSLKPADLITDVMGPMAYSARPDIILQTYLKGLKNGGEVYIYPFYFEQVIWLKKIKGIDISENGFSVKVTLTDRDLVQIPCLHSIGGTPGRPPRYFFEVDEEFRLKLTD